MSAVSGTEPTAIEPLAATVDPDAGDALFADRRDGTAHGVDSVRFRYVSYEVIGSGDGHVTVLDAKS